MHSLFTASTMAFVSAVAAHVILYRRSRSAVAAVICYPAGLVLLVFFVRETSYPLTAIFLYGLLVVGYLLYFVSYTNDAQSPSAKVMDIVRADGPISPRAVASRFTNTELIGMRIVRLVRSGWIEQSGGRLRVTGRGALIAGLFAWYRRLLGWGDGG